MKFDFNGVCKKCGCGTTAIADSNTQSSKEYCFGCGVSIVTDYKLDDNGMLILEGNLPASTTTTITGYGTCLTKDKVLITFTKKPSDERIKELEKEATSLVLWNENKEWLDVIVGSPLMKKDVVLLEDTFAIDKYINEPELD